jgi:hypothetical protein
MLLDIRCSIFEAIPLIIALLLDLLLPHRILCVLRHSFGLMYLSPRDHIPVLASLIGTWGLLVIRLQYLYFSAAQFMSYTLEIYLISEAIFRLMYIDHITIGGSF